jgi:hypothetical protein
LSFSTMCHYAWFYLVLLVFPSGMKNNMYFPAYLYCIRFNKKCSMHGKKIVMLLTREHCCCFETSILTFKFLGCML